LLHTVYLPRHDATEATGAITAAQAVDPLLKSAADRLHTVGTVPRLAVVRSLLAGPRTTAEVAGDAAMSLDETAYHLAALRKAGLVTAESGPQDLSHFSLRGELSGWFAELLGGSGT
jgi:DNA-binding transcriptional ArsR family regulator